MKIIVFGATARVGACIVEQAAAAGHKVSVFVRNQNRLHTQAGNVTVFEGD